MSLTSSYFSIIQKYRMSGAFGQVLDLGPGWVWPGQEWLTDPEAQITGLGYTPDQQAAAQAIVRNHKALRRAEYRTSGLEAFPFPDRSMDVVVAFGSVRAWDKPLRILEEVSRVLKIGGVFAIGDARQDVGWWQRWLAAQFSAQRLRTLYHGQAGTSLMQMKRLSESVGLPDTMVEIAGPDLWMLNRLS